MSVIAVVTVMQCDGCEGLLVLKDDDEYRNFDVAWHDGLNVDYCHSCRHKAEYRAAILADAAARQQIAARIDFLNTTEEPKHVH